MSPIPPPPGDTLVLAVEVGAEDVHFLDNIVKSHDHLAQVRRDYLTVRGRPCYAVHVPPDLLDETRAVLERLRDFIRIGLVCVVPPEEVPADDD